MRFRIYLPPANRHSSLTNRRLHANVEPGISAKRQLLIEQLCQRQLLASVSGIVFEDTNASWRPDAAEIRFASRVVFADTNDDGLLDDNESFALTDAAGRFELDGLSDDESIIRLFNGSSSNSLPLFPVAPGTAAGVIPLNGGSEIANLNANQALTLAGASVVRTDVATGINTSVVIPATARAAEWLPDGRILVLASDSNGNHAFTINANGTVAPAALQTPAPANGWSDVAIDTSGNGVLVEQSSSNSLLRAISVASSITVGNSTTTVDAGTRAIGGGHTTTVISTPTTNGIQLQLWSNATGTVIGSGAIDIIGGKEVLSYDDTSGLVLLKNAADSVTLLDAAANFASLQTIAGISGPVAIDPARELLYVVSPTDSLLKIIDLNTANTLGQFALDTSSIATASKLAFDSTTGKLLLLTASGIAPITLDRSNTNRIKTAVVSPTYDLLFALNAATTNTAPKFDQLPALTTPEDTTLVLASPKLLEKASDAEGDSFIVTLDTQAAHGVLTIKPTGGLTYIPNHDFYGVDTFKVILNDGQTPSDPIELSINVTPVVDPISFTLTPNVIPENVAQGFIAGTIVLSNVDGGQISWNVDDPRFEVASDVLIIAPGAAFDYETETTVNINVKATSSTGQSASKQVAFNISNQDDPIDDIQPHAAAIDENRPGELIGEITVFSSGENQQYVLSVDDSRFEISFRDLRLKPGISLDYESERTVTVNVTAKTASGVSLTQPVVITLRDIAEQASTIELSDHTVKELVRGAVVGDVIVDGNVVGNGYIVTVDDSRFEVNNSKLKLRTSEFIRRSDQQQIQVVVTVQDTSGAFLPVAGTFVLDVLANDNPFHNSNNPYDVNGDNSVNPVDALLILNSIRRHGGPGPVSDFPSPDGFYDVNGDGNIDVLDALLILNYLNRHRPSGEQQPATPEVAGPVAPESVAPSANLLAAPARNVPTTTPNNDRFAFVGPVLESVVDEKVSVFLDKDLEKLRDQVIKMLAADNVSDKEDVDAAIKDLLIE